MLRPTLSAALIALSLAPAWAQPVNLLPPAQPRETAPAEQQVPPADKPLLEEPSPNFQAIRPLEAIPAPAPVPAAPVVPAPAASVFQPPAPPVLQQPASPVPVVQPMAMAAMDLPASLPLWATSLLILFGAFLAGLFGILTSVQLRRGELRRRRRAVVATLATELETRRLAFESVPLPPNVDAGVSFVSSVTSLAGIDAGFRCAQADINLLPEKLAAHVSVHYAAVQRVSDFVKGQSMAAAVRMLQANRMGGQPCPDAGAMREAHVELGAAFRGTDKLVQALRGIR